MSSKHVKKYYFGGWKLTAVIAVIAVIAFFVVLNPFNFGVEKPDDDMRIAVLLPLSGDYAMNGNIYLKGIEAAQKELKEKGISYDLVFYDTMGDGTVASHAYFDVYDSGIPVIIGPVYSDETIAVAAYAEILGTVVVSPGATSQLLEEYDNYTYKLKSTDKYLARGFATLFSEKFVLTAELASQIQNIAVIYDSSLYELTIFSTYLEELEEAKKESETINRMNVSTYPLTSVDDAAAYLIDTKPDCVVLFVSTQDAIEELIKKTEDAGVSPYWMGEETLLLADLSTVGDGVDNKIIALTSVELMTNPLFSFDAVESGEVPSPSAIQYGYDALMIVNNAIQSNGYSAESIKKGLDNLRTVGLSGTIAFDETKTRYPSYDILIWTGKDTGWMIK
ncbi:MAG: ABC transporter substrate-binding protein [Methanocorpusculum sp.]|nr:ABC transporter substrate-binding protein [Methanocorpusculum sp.]